MYTRMKKKLKISTHLNKAITPNRLYITQKRNII